MNISAELIVAGSKLCLALQGRTLRIINLREYLMKKMPFITLLLIVSFSFLQMDCRKEEQIIPPDNRPILGKRNYLWKIDTISYPGSLQTIMSSIWGYNSNNVYTVGHNEGQAGTGTIYMFDGNKWSPVIYHADNGGDIEGSISLNGVFGFSSKDVWVVGEKIYENPNNSEPLLDSSFVMHFNGIKWHEHKILGNNILTVWGVDSNNVWVGGWNGCFFLKNNNEFIKQPLNPNYSVKKITGNKTDSVYIFSYSGQGATFYSTIDIYNNKTNNLVRIDSTQTYPVAPKFGQANIFISSNGDKYTCGIGGVYKKSGSSPNQVGVF